MKIRSEFVTNSSSTSFGASLGDALVGLLMGLGLSNCECSNDENSKGDKETEGGGGGGEDSAMQGAMDAAAQAAKDAADQMAADAAAKDALINNILDAEGAKLDAAGSKLDSEIDAYTKQWADAQKGADPADVDKLNKQYQDYLDYLKSQKDLVDARKYELAVTKAEEEAAKAAKTDWIKQRQQDLIQVQEQKAFLEAVAKGYGAHKDYDINAVNSQLKALNDRENSIRGTLKDNNAEIDYTPKDRSPIGPDPEIIRLQGEHKKKMDVLQNEINAAKEARNNQRRDALIKEQQWQQKVAENEMKKAGFWNVMTKAGEVTQVVADTGVDILSNLTGPAGKTIKTLYTGIKGVAGGVGEGLANGDMSKNIAKGALEGLTEVVGDKLGDAVDGKKWGKAIEAGYTVVSEAGKSMAESALDGKTSASDLIQSGLSGGAGGALDASLGTITDHIFPGGPDLPEDLDYSGMGLKDFISSIRKTNPLSNGKLNKFTGLNPGKQAITDGLQSAGLDQATGWIKGDPVIFQGTEQGVTEKIIEGTTTAMTPTVKSGLKMAGNAMKATAQTVGKMAQQAAAPSPYRY